MKWPINFKDSTKNILFTNLAWGWVNDDATFIFEYHFNCVALRIQTTKEKIKCCSQKRKNTAQLQLIRGQTLTYEPLDLLTTFIMWETDKGANLSPRQIWDIYANSDYRLFSLTGPQKGHIVTKQEITWIVHHTSWQLLTIREMCQAIPSIKRSRNAINPSHLPLSFIHSLSLWSSAFPLSVAETANLCKFAPANSCMSWMLMRQRSAWQCSEYFTGCLKNTKPLLKTEACDMKSAD